MAEKKACRFKSQVWFVLIVRHLPMLLTCKGAKNYETLHRLMMKMYVQPAYVKKRSKHQLISLSPNQPTLLPFPNSGNNTIVFTNSYVIFLSACEL